MTTFSTRISGIPCQCKVTVLAPAVPAFGFGFPWEDACPAEPAEVEIEVFDRKGYKAPWLASKLTQEDIERLVEEAEAAALADRYDIDF